MGTFGKHCYKCYMSFYYLRKWMRFILLCFSRYVCRTLQAIPSNVCMFINLPVYKHICVVLVAQSCQTLCHPLDCSPPGSSIYGMFQARILEWVAIPFSRKPSSPGIKTQPPSLQADSLLLSHRGSTKYFTLSLSKAIRKGTDLYKGL